MQALKELRDARNFPQEDFDLVVNERVGNNFGFDHNYCNHPNGEATKDPREVAKLIGSTGRTMTVTTTEAGVQCFTAN